MAVLTSTSVTGVTTMSIAGDFTAYKYIETAVAIGNSGTAATLNLNSGSVFTATLTGNCTFTITNAGAVSSLILILTNDATPSRTVAWAYSGGTFRYPGGSVTRTTSASAVDIWYLTTPNSGTTWYVSIPMANIS
jgi:hypothetical protein